MMVKNKTIIGLKSRRCGYNKKEVRVKNKTIIGLKFDFDKNRHYFFC